jgi:nitrogen-specific signal transduction histidine kinase
MTFEQQWIEYDYNPFILFESNGKIKSVNAEAQFLLGAVTPSELFNLATTYANVTFGFKTTFIKLEFGRYNFFALTVGYENDNEIGLKLYQVPSFKLNNLEPVGELTNIYTLVDLCISTNSINSNIVFTKEFDPAIPDIIIDSNSFIKIFNKIYSYCLESKKINTKIYYRIGEHIKFEDKKYTIFSIEVSADKLNMQELNELEVMAANTNFYLDINKKITINIPMITK